MAVLSVQNLDMEFGERTLFSGVSFEVGERDKIGFIGSNATGKTTLFKLITGELEPTLGGVYPGKNIKIGYLEQHACAGSQKTVYDEMESVFEPLMKKEKQLEELADLIEAGHGDINALIAEQNRLHTEFEDEGGLTYKSRTRSALTGLGFSESDFSLPCSLLSGGQRSKLALGKLLLSAPDLLLLDEPTNHLDLETMEWLENYLKAYRGAVLVVSHDRYFLDAVCTRIWELRGKSIKIYRGNYSTYLPQREAADERQQKLHDAAVEKAAKLQDYVDRNLVRASTTKMAQSRRKQLEKLEIVEAPTTEAWELNFRFEYDIEPYDELVIMKNLSVHIGEHTLIDALDYVVHRGDKLVIAGPNGAGKSTLLQVLDGKRRPSGGMVRLGSGAKPGVFTQQQARRAGRVIDAIWNQYPRFTELEVRSHLARFGYRGEEVFKDCASLSGGELARLRLPSWRSSART